ncbi:DUF2015 domain-containing protein [Acetobacter pasteurianus]|nr:DUF2015 domain-containing protein [Acetobacter pasteurianus]
MKYITKRESKKSLKVDFEKQQSNWPRSTSPSESQPQSQSVSLSFSFSFIKAHHVFLIFLVVLGLLVFHFRYKIGDFLDRYRTRRRMREQGYYENIESFEDDINDGLSSLNFDLEANNVNLGDTRAGLDAVAKTEIRKIMDDRGLSFDEARLEYTKGRFNENGIDEDGLPRDPKLVRF